MGFLHPAGAVGPTAPMRSSPSSHTSRPSATSTRGTWSRWRADTRLVQVSAGSVIWVSTSMIE